MTIRIRRGVASERLLPGLAGLPVLVRALLQFDEEIPLGESARLACNYRLGDYRCVSAPRQDDGASMQQVIGPVFARQVAAFQQRVYVLEPVDRLDKGFKSLFKHRHRE
jgi:hypothetical protein